VPANSSSSKTLAYFSYAFIALVWGTTYYAIKVAIEAFPPFLMAGTRQFGAAAIMGLMLLGSNKPVHLTGKKVAQNALIGFLMITMGNGVVSWAEQWVPSGITALVCSTMPIWVVLINLIARRQENFNALIAVGMLLGVAGVALIFQADVSALANRDYLAGILVLVVATSCWGGGSVLMQKWGDSENAFLDITLQIFFGSLFLLLWGFATERGRPIELHNAHAWGALAYLVVFGSILAMSAYQYALKRLPVSFVTSYAYINPLVAVAIGAFTGETLTKSVIIAFALVLSGVLLVRQGNKKPIYNKQKNIS
jgi:drug/metabolite transporter (DMT)-like permease